MKPPFCLMTPVGTPVAEERFVPMVQSYVQEPLAQTFSSAFSQTVHGRPIKSGTPQEVEAAIWNVIKLREAARAAGRPISAFTTSFRMQSGQMRCWLPCRLNSVRSQMTGCASLPLPN
jgi:hypothetical protein